MSPVRRPGQSGHRDRVPLHRHLRTSAASTTPRGARRSAQRCSSTVPTSIYAAAGQSGIGMFEAVRSTRTTPAPPCGRSASTPTRARGERRRAERAQAVHPHLDDQACRRRRVRHDPHVNDGRASAPACGSSTSPSTGSATRRPVATSRTSSIELEDFKQQIIDGDITVPTRRSRPNRLGSAENGP